MKDRLKEILNDPKRKASLERRFWEKVSIQDENKCWPWIAKAKANFGYGAINSGRKNGTFKSNRVAYYLTKGDIPEGMCVLHSCDNPACCNPVHLRLGTKKENTRDAIKRRRLKKPPVVYGERHHNTKMTDLDIAKVLTDSRPYIKIAAQFGVSTMTIYRIKNSKTWINHEDIKKRSRILT